jgi:hypothetical protein
LARDLGCRALSGSAPARRLLALVDAFRPFLPGFHRASLLGLFKDRLSIDLGCSRPLLRSSSVGIGHMGRGFGSSVPPDGSCSTFAVSHRLDGLLRRQPCGSVAPRCRSWGSPGFGPSGRVPFGVRSACLPRRRLGPSELLPRSQPCLFRGLLPSCRSASGNPALRLQGFAPRDESVASRRCCHCLWLVALLGFSSVKRGGRDFLVVPPPACSAFAWWGSTLPTCPDTLGALSNSGPPLRVLADPSYWPG